MGDRTYGMRGDRVVGLATVQATGEPSAFEALGGAVEELDAVRAIRSPRLGKVWTQRRACSSASNPSGLGVGYCR
jgi:hypothetical protein